MLLVILTGGIDLSVAAVATGSAYLLATTADMGAGTGIIIGMALGLVVGIINGIGVAVLRVQPLVMTLGTGLMTAGAITVYSQKVLASSPRIPEFLQAIGSGKVLHYVPIDLVVWVPLSFLMIWGLRRTGFGRLLYAIGDNRDACRLAGIRVWQVLLVDYVLCSVLAAAAGLMLVGSTNAADLGLADIYLLPSVAAVIIGGTSIFGGRGGYSGAIIGAIILTVLNSLLTLLDSPEPIKQILYGAIILVLAAAYTRLTD
jgi:ribose transport system permease protein